MTVLMSAMTVIMTVLVLAMTVIMTVLMLAMTVPLKINGGKNDCPHKSYDTSNDSYQTDIMTIVISIMAFTAIMTVITSQTGAIEHRVVICLISCFFPQI